MQKREIKGLDQFETSERGKAQTTAKAGRKSYSRKSGKGSSQSQRRRRGGKAGEGKRRQSDRQGTAYKYTSEDVSRIVQERTEGLRKRVSELSAENKVLREILISGFKDWFAKQKEKEEKGNDGQ